MSNGEIIDFRVGLVDGWSVDIAPVRGFVALQNMDMRDYVLTTHVVFDWRLDTARGLFLFFQTLYRRTLVKRDTIYLLRVDVHKSKSRQFFLSSRIFFSQAYYQVLIPFFLLILSPYEQIQ